MTEFDILDLTTDNTLITDAPTLTYTTEGRVDLTPYLVYYIEEQTVSGNREVNENAWTPRGGQFDKPVLFGVDKIAETLSAVETLNATGFNKVYRVVMKMDLSDQYRRGNLDLTTPPTPLDQTPEEHEERRRNWFNKLIGR